MSRRYQWRQTPGEGTTLNPMKLTREGLDRLTQELGLRLDSEELETLFRRLHSLRQALDALEELVEPALEPFPTATLPEEE